jgi:hypothetical protein
MSCPRSRYSLDARSLSETLLKYLEKRRHPERTFTIFAFKRVNLAYRESLADKARKRAGVLALKPNTGIDEKLLPRYLWVHAQHLP